MSAETNRPRMLGELPGFIAEMDAATPWEPVPLLLEMTEPNGPVDQDFFEASCLIEKCYRRG